MQLRELTQLEREGLAERTIHNRNEAYIVNENGRSFLYSLELKGFPYLARLIGDYERVKKPFHKVY